MCSKSFNTSPSPSVCPYKDVWKTKHKAKQKPLSYNYVVEVVREKKGMDTSLSTSGCLDHMGENYNGLRFWSTSPWKPTVLLCCQSTRSQKQTVSASQSDPTPAQHLFNTYVPHSAVHLPFPAYGFNLGVSGGVRKTNRVKQRLMHQGWIEPVLILPSHVRDFFQHRPESRRAGVVKVGF